MSRSPPLRFLVVVLGGWAAMRTAIVAPPWSTPPADAASASPRAQGGGVAASPRREVRPSPNPARGTSRAQSWASLTLPVQATIRPLRQRPRARPAPPFSRMMATGIGAPAATDAAAAIPSRSSPHLPPARPASQPAAGRRWSLSLWSFARRGGAAPLAAGGLLGGSQAGARLVYRVNRDQRRPLALSARLSAPLPGASGAEAALGLDWRPSRRVPVHLLVERRQALGGEGRSAFAATLHGGVSDAPVGRFRIDAYAQAGIVGTRSRDPFADGSLRLSLPAGERVRLGAGAWAAAQPGVSRLDLGPQAALRLPVAGRTVTVAADWRLRIAGDAGPGSGPTLTLSTDF